MTDRFKEILDLEAEVTEGPWDQDDDFYIMASDGSVLAPTETDDERGEVYRAEDAKFIVRSRNSIRPIIELLLQAEEGMRDFCSKVDRGEARSTKSYAKFADTLQAIDKFRKGER